MRSTYLFDRLVLEVKIQNEGNLIDFERLLELINYTISLSTPKPVKRGSLPKYPLDLVSTPLSVKDLSSSRILS